MSGLAWNSTKSTVSVICHLAAELFPDKSNMKNIKLTREPLFRLMCTRGCVYKGGILNAVARVI